MPSQLPTLSGSRWVKGHQDDDPTHDLDEWACLNIKMDMWAKYFWEITHQDSAPRQQKIDREPWALWIGDKKICRELRAQIQDHIQGTEAHWWWMDNKQIPPHLGMIINWNAGGTALK